MRNMISIRILFLTIVFSIFEVSSYTGGNTHRMPEHLQQEPLLTSKDNPYQV